MDDLTKKAIGYAVEKALPLFIAALKGKDLPVEIQRDLVPFAISDSLMSPFLDALALELIYHHLIAGIQFVKADGAYDGVTGDKFKVY